MQQVSLDEAESRHWPVLQPIAGPRENPVALNRSVCLIGSRTRVNLSLPAPEVSRAHALLLCDDRGVYLRDLASLNHVYVNDRPVREKVLDEGDELRIGPFVFRCERGFRRSAAPSNGQLPTVGLEAESDHARIPLSGRTTLLGTRQECDVLMSDPLAAPAHAVIFEQDGQRYIRDLRTAAGTFVNDKRIELAELKPGDVIRIGDTPLRYELMPEPQAAAGPTAPPASQQAAGKKPIENEEFNIIPLRDEQEPTPGTEESVLSLRDENDEALTTSSDDSGGSGLAALEDFPVEELPELSDSQHPGHQLNRPSEGHKERAAKSSPEAPARRSETARKVKQSSR